MGSDNHHWVPKLLLKSFADSDGRLYCLDIHSDEVTKPPPRLAASEPGFNDFLIIVASFTGAWIETFDQPTWIDGDKGIPGQIYIGFSGSGAQVRK